MPKRRRCVNCGSTARELRLTHYELVPAEIRSAGVAAGIAPPPAWVCVNSSACILSWPLR